jgi:serine phosphatase RsbU (regulator of sigma subunit)
MLAVAGHPPPLIVREGGSVQTTSAHGTMLGAVDDPVFHTGEISLHVGDAIVIYSDGIFDTRLRSIRVDEQHLAEMLSGSSAASAQELVNRLITALEGVDRPLRDDIAIMVLQRTATA